MAVQDEEIRMLLDASDRLISSVSCNFKRYLAGQIDWLAKMSCVKGPKGTLERVLPTEMNIKVEGAEVVGVYEIKSEVSGLQRNVMQCLTDYNIPLHLSTTVTRVFGQERLEAIEIAKVDDNMGVIKGTEQIIECDALILSVGLMPENELAENLGVEIDKYAKGAKCDNNFETTVDHIYTCGNATHVNDLADYVSLSAQIAGRAVANKHNERKLVNINIK